MRTSIIFFSFFILILPFLLWRLSMIGTPVVSRKHGAGFAPNYVPEPVPIWLDLSTYVDAVTRQHGATLLQTLTSSLPGMHITLNSMIAQDKIIGMSLRCLQHALEHQDSQFLGLNVDYDHINAVSFTLSSDAATSSLLGQPKPVPHAGTEFPFFTKPLKATSDANIYVIRFTKWCPRGNVFLNGLRINQLIIEDTFAADVMIDNCWINSIRMFSNVAARKPTIRLWNTRVQDIYLNPHCCTDILLRDFYVWHIHCPPPEYGNPFFGSMTISGDVELGETNMLERSIQHYRNLRHNLTERKAAWAVYMIRAIELRAERKYYSSRIMRAINFLYDASSGYGNIPERALGVILCLVVYNILLVWLNGLYSVGVDCRELHGSGWLRTMARAT